MHDENKPFLVETREGFSVQYKQKFLYSKYSPKKNILNIINNLHILPDTLILCFSPVLDYGLQELSEKLPSNCLMLACEKEPELFELSKQNLTQSDCYKNGLLHIINIAELSDLPLNITKYGFFKRAISIDFSAGVSFYPDFYNELFCKTRDAIAQWWKNRITLVKFGRKYSTNLIKNLPQISNSYELPKIDNPILIVGAGESSLQILKEIKHKQLESKITIICVDASLQMLSDLNIKCDFAICEEAQSVIARAFTGTQDIYDTLLLSATSTPSVSHIKNKKSIFYTSVYTDANFLNDLIENKILESPLPPLGSVGLIAVKLACMIRADENVPVYVTGLDFSFSRGFTHATGSFHDRQRRSSSTKINSFTAFNACFNYNASSFIDKNAHLMYTTQNLSMYAELFKYVFYNFPNLYCLSKEGYDLNLQMSSLDDIKFNEKKSEASESKTDKSEKIKNYIKFQIEALTTLKKLFTEKTESSKEELNQKIYDLLNKMEYLYLHFPDGYKISLNQDFLNRVRVEIDYFLNLFQQSLNRLN